MHVATMMPRLSLAPHVRACECEGQVILLDMRRNRYLGVGGPASAALFPYIQGWPAMAAPTGLPGPSRPSCLTPRPANVQEVTQRFVAQDLLTDSDVQHSLGATVRPTIAPASASLNFEDQSAEVHFDARRVALFVKGVALAGWRLRFRSLDAIARAVTGRRNRNLGTTSSSLAAMEAAAIGYERLRPFAFTSRQKCLFDSLALIEFLAGERLFPYWIIGVKTGPFGAHSWVQCGSTVLNDQYEYVRRFRPILVA